MAYRKVHGEAFFELVELSLGLLFKVANNFIIKPIQRKSIYREYNSCNHDQFSSKQVANHFYNLKRHGYIEEIECEGEKSIKLTNKAKIRMIESMVLVQPHDKKYRFVSFDIPERLHLQRNLFRKTIKRMGFRQIQQSLWATDKNVGELVEVVAAEYKVSDYVAYIIADKTNIDVLVKNTLESV